MPTLRSAVGIDSRSVGDQIAGLLDFMAENAAQIYDGGSITYRISLNFAIFAEGHDFIFDDGFVSNGTIESLSNQDSGFDFLDLRGLDLTVPEAFQLADGDPNVLAATIFSGKDVIVGGADNDYLNGFAGADTLRGGRGDDKYVVDAKGDKLIERAGQGTDTALSKIDVRLDDGQSIDNLKLTGSDDIDGFGNGLDNLVTGNAGDNLVAGGAGIDALAGLGGSDRFLFDGGMERDRIRDFSSEDRILLDQEIFAGLPLGRLKASAFKDIGEPGARLDASDRIIYDSDTGVLVWDSDGSGPDGQTLFGRLLNRADIGHADFLVVA